ncbi:hypothetical protein [Corynebacterium aquatimens]|uniref:Uncharacterized protein n=1 Tax=Corynebacterium aquatimens TaxID=1190508 RepID=A0A931DWM0_9CORY|nr:hypothetical protein [Corynebacterium aquatimens]MBG6122874.1 hypothetical protein [Corynebacterium aquatimens]WJY66791.1 hypothetical protein CAQUA_10520 [Corynebacterium aquatimens]
MTNQPNLDQDLSDQAEAMIRNNATDDDLQALLTELEETVAVVRTEIDARSRLLNDDASAAFAAEAEAGTAAGTETGVEAGTVAATDAETGAGLAAGAEAEAPVVDKHGLSQEQLDELDKVPYYMTNLRGRWSSLFDLLHEFRNEMREGRAK